MKRRTVVAVVGVVVTLGGLAAGIASRRDKDATPVTFAKVQRSDLTSKVTCNGRIDAKRKVDLSANVMGQVVNLAVREGDTIRRGDFLLQIDRNQLAANVDGAAASLRAVFSDRDAARANSIAAAQDYDRAARNYEQKIIPVAELDRARSARDSAAAALAALEQRISQARANLTAARDTLSKTTMRSPMDGIVTALPVHEGEVAVIGTMNNPGTKLMTIADMSVVEAVMEVDETDIPSVKVGQRASVTIDAYPNRTFGGIVTDVGSSPIVQSAAGQNGGSQAVNFEVKIGVENPPAGVRPGFSCSADIITGTRQKVLAVPIQALVVREKGGRAQPGAKSRDEEGVYVRDGQKVRFASVMTGLTGDSSIEVLNGLRERDEIVTGPFKALRELKDGAKVKEQKEAKGAS